jgi:type II secretory pathway component PulF
MKVLSRLFVVMVGVMVCAVPCFAQAPTAPTVDWGSGLASILTYTGTTLSATWPYIALILALFIGVRIVMNLPKRAAK